MKIVHKRLDKLKTKNNELEKKLFNMDASVPTFMISIGDPSPVNTNMENSTSQSDSIISNNILSNKDSIETGNSVFSVLMACHYFSTVQMQPVQITHSKQLSRLSE